MSVADSGPYKSRLFNFISQTAQKLTDEGSRTWRYFKYATEMTLQTALYPVYFLLQTVRVTRQKLGTTIKQHFPQLASKVNAEPSQPPEVDTPIVHVLNTVATQTESRFENSITSAPVVLNIQGIASQVDSQTLVLVQKDNVILDSLTVEEQHHLQQQIVLEVANYYYYYQHLAQHQKPFQPQLKPSFHSPHLLSPIRWFWQVMSWVQTSPVAVKINCFGESDFAESISFPCPSPSAQLIYTLDGAIAQVEDYSIVPLSEATHSLVQHSQTWGQTVIQVWQKPPQTDVAVKSESSLEQGFDEYFYKIQSLILAAIDYFFGEHHPPLTSEENSEQFSNVISSPKSSPTSTLPQTPLEDPWLTPEMMAENILSKLKKPKSTKFRPASFSPNPLTSDQSSQNRVREKVQSSLNRFKTAPTPEHLSSTPPDAAQPLTKSPNYVIESPKTSNSSTPEAKPDWLEAQVTATGYIKHPLERILGWLDQIMVKVEETIAKAWYWLTHYQKN